MHSVRVVRVNPAAYLTPDPRFKSWVKLIASKADIDLRLAGGFALRTKIQPFDQPYTLLPGQFLLLAAQHGTRKKQQYNHVLLYVDNTGYLHEFDRDALSLDDGSSDNDYYWAVSQYCCDTFDSASVQQVQPVNANAVDLTHIKTRVLIDELDSRIARDDCDIVSYLAGMIENLSDSQLIEFVVNRGYAIVNENSEEDEDECDPFE